MRTFLHIIHAMVIALPNSLCFLSFQSYSVVDMMQLILHIV